MCISFDMPIKAWDIVRSWYISQANQVGYEKGGGTVNCIV